MVLSKGIERNTLLLPTQIIDDVFTVSVHKAVVSGPSFALDLAKRQITAVIVAAEGYKEGRALRSVLKNDYFIPYISDDCLGVQICGAVKNVIAIAVGIVDGLGYTDNTQAFLVTRGLHEMGCIIQSIGGKTETAYGLAGVGDLLLTALGNKSRNRTVGKRIGGGETLSNILEKTGYIPEGINTVHSIYQFMQKKNLNLPICRSVYQILFEGGKVTDLLNNII